MWHAWGRGERGVYRVLIGRPERRNHWEDLGIGARYLGR
jgi:hypothetical protein